MGDYIKREDVIALVQNSISDMVAYALGKKDSATVLDVDAINAIPSADVREVVTCKECKYYKAENKGKPWKSNRRYCVRSAAVATNPDDFCSRGEKREES